MNDTIDIFNYAENIKKAEKLIGYEFNDKNLLLKALTHPSVYRGASKFNSYERLEFLGDSLLSAIVAQRAFKKYPKMDEGQLTHVRVALVSGSMLSNVAKTLGLQNCIIFGESEERTGKRGLQSALEDVFEAIIAAIYLDTGLETAVAFVDKYIVSKMTKDGKLAIEDNPKSILQEKLQAKKEYPQYAIIEEYGPAHDKTFVAEVSSNGKILAQGSGKTKKEAESKAADTALCFIG